MKRILMSLILLATMGVGVVNADSYKAYEGFVMEVAYGISDTPRESKLTDGVFEVESLDIEPEDFSEGMNNNGDKTILLGLQMDRLGDMKVGVLIGLRAHLREGISYEADFSGRIIIPKKDWNFFVGGGFGFGELEVAFDQITFNTGDTIDYPEKLKFSTAFFMLGADYKLTENWNIGITYELKEIVADGSDIDVSWEGSNPVNTTTMQQAVNSYESTTHSLYFSLKYRF